jgi:hypothetical protein
LLPTTAGEYAAWTPSASTNVSNVDEAAPDSDTTYNSTDVEDEIDSFNVTDISVPAATIYGLQVGIFARKESAGTANIQRVYRDNDTTDDVGASFDPSITYAYQKEIMESNPVGVEVWTVADVNAAEFGYKAVA